MSGMDFAGSPSSDGAHEEVNVSVPRGSPIYVPNFVGPLTRVPVFESDVLRELQELEVEISSGLALPCDEDISVDELKVFTEEELMDIAMKKIAKDGEFDDCSQQLTENQPSVLSSSSQGISSEGHTVLEDWMTVEAASTASKCTTESAPQSIKESARRNNSKKRKPSDRNPQALVVSYIAKVEEVAIIKRKQDEDKAAARLHSLSVISKIDEGTMPPAVGNEKSKMIRLASSALKLKSSSIQEHVPVRYPEVVLCIEVCHASKLFKTQEFLVLGQQQLTELRDKIYCPTDHAMKKAKLFSPSGYFLIEDTFFNDMRDPHALDYSQPILHWLRTSKEEALRKWESVVSGKLEQKQKAVMGDAVNHRLPQFRAVDMQKARFCDLKFQLGVGYVYCHQGGCKHRIVIRDMRLIHPEDVQNRATYPIITFQPKLRAHKCFVCKIFRATKVTVDDKWAGENPCYFCDNCYFLLHYSKDRSLLYSDFSVYDYHPGSSL